MNVHDETALDNDIRRHLVHLEVERRLAARTLATYGEAFARLARFAAAQALGLREVQSQHVRRWAAQLHSQGLASRSIALELSAWRGFYRWLGRDGLVASNPVDGVRAPRAAKPLPKALSVEQAVALAEQRGDGGTLAARDHCLVELLYGCGLRVGELVGLPIDHFVLAELQKRSLSPSPEADRYTIIRRVNLDLLGLLPGLTEVDAFVHDSRPSAYEDLVDRPANFLLIPSLNPGDLLSSG